MALLFLLILVMAFRPMLPDVVGDFVWPRLLPLRAQGRAGLFVSWLAYYVLITLAWLLLVAALTVVGLRISVPSWEAGLVAGFVLVLATVQTLRNTNPSRDWDVWRIAAYRLLARLRDEDLDRLKSMSKGETRSRALTNIYKGAPSSEYLEHLQRLLYGVEQEAEIDLTAKDVALDLVKQRICGVKDALECGSAGRPA
jgi:hypothetical protein